MNPAVRLAVAVAGGALLASGSVSLVPAPALPPPPGGARPPPSSSVQEAGRIGPALRLPPPDSALQHDLERLLQRSRYRRAARGGRISVALVDLSRPDRLRYAGFDDDRMRYAASLPKIAVMLAVFDRVEADELPYTPRLRRRLARMIRHSDNEAASALIRTVGFEAIAHVLRDPEHRLYDPDRNGGLWVGKGYGSGVGRWRRDPLHGTSHGATARQTARFLVMVERGELVSPWASAEMKALMGRPAIGHKFVAGLRSSRPSSRIFRKSGTYRSWHADAAIVERGDLRYAAVVLARADRGGRLLSRLIVDLDELVGASLDEGTGRREPGMP